MGGWEIEAAVSEKGVHAWACDYLVNVAAREELRQPYICISKDPRHAVREESIKLYFPISSQLPRAIASKLTFRAVRNFIP